MGLKVQPISHKSTKKLQLKERHDRILDVARGLFEAQGYQGTTTAQIAREAGVPEGTLFEDFPTKRDLVFSLLERDMEVYLDFLELQLRGIEGSLNRIRKFVWSHLYTWRKRRFVARFLILEIRQDPRFEESAAYHLSCRYIQLLLNLIKEGIEDGSIGPEVNPEMVMHLILGAIDHTVLPWALKEEPFDVDASAKDLCDLIFKGIRPGVASVRKAVSK